MYGLAWRKLRKKNAERPSTFVCERACSYAESLLATEGERAGAQRVAGCGMGRLHEHSFGWATLFIAAAASDGWRER
jgi:hypothetical protein